MKRFEIIVNRAIEEDVIDALASCGHGEAFTCVSPVFGRGNKGRREGSAVWPETNAVFLLFVEEADGEALREAMRRLKIRNPGENLRCYESEGFGRSV